MIEFLDPYVYINNPHWQSKGNIIFLCKYYIVISDTLVGSFLDVLFLLLAVTLSASCETKKECLSFKEIIQKNLCDGHRFFDCTPYFLCNSLLLSWSIPFPFPSDVLAQWSVWVVFCVTILWVNGRKYENLLQFNTSWLAALRT